MSGAATREALRRRRLFYRPHGRVLLAHFVETLARHFDGADSVGAAERRALPLLSWGRTYLPEHFSRAPSGMHRWLEEQLEHARHERGQKVNAIGPRGGAKSTIGTLALPLRAALEGSEKYIWIVSDTKQQAAAHLANIKAELIENVSLTRDYPRAAGMGPVWRSNAIVLRNGVAIDALGTGQRMRGKRQRASRPSLIICDRMGSRVERVSFAWERGKVVRW